jgi:fructose-1-phosphate kinase PfkB-like protein
LAEDFRGLLSALVDGGRQVWVDTSGTALSTALGFPNLGIKVNGDEIGELLGFEIQDFGSARRALTALRDREVKASVITLGPAGALLANKDGRWLAQGPQVDAVSTVGSGDAFLGGLVCALDAGKDWQDALCDAVAAGTANTLLAGGGQFRLQDFEDIRKQIRVESW